MLLSGPVLLFQRPRGSPAWSAASGQSTLEWTGLVLLVSGLMLAAILSGVASPALGLAHSISRGMLCAVSLRGGCESAEPLEVAYGAEAAALVKRHAPDLHYGPDLLGLPVDFRTCRSPYCADAGRTGVVTRSLAGEPVTLFTRFIDCRGGSDGAAGKPAADCGEAGRGNAYIQYWAYYPESASLRNLPVLRERGWHPHDWESVQVRLGSGGQVDQRVSSHAGYNHTRSSGNWGSDLGWGWLNAASELVGARRSGGWGEASGRALIAGGSHAGNAEGKVTDARYPSRTPAGRIRLVPLEGIRGDSLVRAARFDPITPPWAKAVWTDPEAEGTG